VDIDALVLAAASRTGVRARGADTYSTPAPPAQISVITLASQADAIRLADACMTDGIPARATRTDSGEHVVLVLH
jgi:hypothetical protein